MKKRFGSTFKLLTVMVSMCTAMGNLGVGIVFSKPIENQSLDAYLETLSSYVDEQSYGEYLTGYDQTKRVKKTYKIDGTNYSKVEGMDVKVLKDYEGEEGESLLTGEQGLIEWQVNIEEAGLYNMSVLYYPVEGKSSDIQRGLFIDHELPFSEASTITFDRFWMNEKEEIEVDNQGNDIRASQIEAPRWCTERVEDTKGYYNEPYSFYLSEGVHTITFVSQREPMIIKSINLYAEDEVPSYEELYKEYEAKGYKKAMNEPIIIEAESANLKSSPMLYAITDHSSPAITPYSPSAVKINTIGGNKWNTAGQWIEWEVDVPEDGLYELGLNVKQNFVRGNFVSRKLTIDGEVPFKEASALPFGYESTWRTEYIGNDEPYLFYLEKGKHTLRLEVVLGELGNYIKEVETSVRNLNTIYRKIIMVTGPEPDKYRDYQLEKTIPEVIDMLRVESERLNKVAQGFSQMAGTSSDRDAILLTVVKQVDMFCEDIEKVIPRLADFKLNIGTIGTWLMDVKSQPLELDELYVLAPGSELPKTNNSLKDRIVHNISKLYYSFIIDYNAIGNVSEDKEAREITVWVPTGRDQANTIKALIDESFTVDTGINVNLMLVQPDTLLPATLSGEGPDVAMQLTNDVPLNYAMRGAVTDLKQFEDFDSVAERFYSSSMVPYRFDEACYALPETETFYMLFYRKDIIKELGLEIPKTWSDVKMCLSVLSKNSMEFGLPVVTVLTADMVYGNFLYQMGGDFYTEDAKTSKLGSDLAVNAFKEWTKYYTDYTLTREYDFVNRFRTGEVPLGIADYQTYNTLQVAAPEIDGLWGFTVMPGVENEDGSINNNSTAGGTSIVIMEKSQDKEAAWEYLKWWTSAETQIQYAREMEALMGAAARHPTANIEALASLPWPAADYENLTKQLESVKGIPQVPGGYYTPRNINNAFYQVVVEKEVGAREALTDAVRYINDEITNKRIEFGLEE